jgi:hypothetical protein
MANKKRKTRDFGLLSIPFNSNYNGFVVISASAAKRLTKLQRKDGHLVERSIVITQLASGKFKAKVQ